MSGYVARCLAAKSPAIIALYRKHNSLETATQATRVFRLMLEWCIITTVVFAWALAFNPQAYAWISDNVSNYDAEKLLQLQGVRSWVVR